MEHPFVALIRKPERDVEMEEVKDRRKDKKKVKKEDQDKMHNVLSSRAVSVATFLFAAAQGDLSLVEHILEEGTAKVNDCDYDKRTALHVASSEGHAEIVQLLLNEGADVNFVDRYNATALDDAIHHGHIEISKFLLERGAKHGQGSNFAVDLVSAAGKGDLKTVEKLVKNGISVQSSDYSLRTPLHVAIAGRHAAVVQFLLDQGADLHVEDKFGGTPIEEAHRAGVRLGEDPLLEMISRYTQDEDHNSWAAAFANPFFITFILLECMIGTLFAIFAIYGEGASAGAPITDGYTAVVERYPFYMDVHVMIFIGFGYLMTFLRKYGYTAVGLTFIIGALSIQVYLLCSTFWGDVLSNNWDRVGINIVSLIKADFAAGAVLISFGALLGKITFTQMLLLTVLEIFFYSLNEAVAGHLAIADIGGSMVIHVYGAFFGLAASFALTPDKAKGNKDNAAIYHSDLFSMIGTIFLWMYWPSFNAALGTGNSQQRAIVNTVLSLTSSCVFAFIFSQFWRRGKHFNMVDIQNATLAGGVAMGSAADMVLHPAFSLLIGATAGTISVFGFSKVQGFVEHRLGIHDTCGVLNLHGMPGIIGAVVSMIGAAVATGNLYSPSQLEFTFPDRTDRSAARQAQLQLAFLLITLAMAIIPGYFCGKVLTGFTFPKKFFVDSQHWETPSREVPYFFDIRGEAKHSNDKADTPEQVAGSVAEQVVDHVALKKLENKVSALEELIAEQKRVVHDQKRLLRSQTRQLDSLYSPGSASSDLGVSPLLTARPPPTRAAPDALAAMLEQLTNKVNFLVDQSSRKTE